MDTHSISIGSGKIDPAAGSVLLVVSWCMTVWQHRMELGLVNLSVPGPLRYPAFSARKRAAAFRAVWSEKWWLHDMQTSVFALLEQTFFFKVYDRIHLALSLSNTTFCYCCSASTINLRSIYISLTCLMYLGLVQLRLSRSIIKSVAWYTVTGLKIFAL